MRQCEPPPRWKIPVTLCFGLLLCSCDGLIGRERIQDLPRPPRAQDLYVCADPGSIKVGSSPVRRLTNVEYENTVEDLLGGALPQLPEQPTDTVLEGSFENDATSLGPSDVRIARYEDAANALADYAVDDPGVRSRLIPCDPSVDAARCGREFVEIFGLRAFRRPLNAEEQSRWLSYFEDQRAAIDFDAAVQLTVSAMLQSPQFLYRLESDESEDAPRELNGYEVANRLSYFLWESMPDQELFDAAARDELRTDAQLEAQARRMLTDRRAAAAIRNFHRQWLHLDRVLDEDKVPAQFPMWGEQTKASAREESLRFIENVILDGGTVTDLFTSNVAYVDEAMAELYGVEAPREQWGRVELDPNERAGILSRIAFLAAHAHDANGSPPLRGVFVMDRILCEPRLSPPADADISPPQQDPNQGPRTNRELFEERVAPDTCRGCHVRIDGFGYGFEAYDAAGIFRELDNGFPVDASGFAIGLGSNETEYDGAVELQGLLAQSEVVHECVSTQWFTYAYGRSLEAADACQLQALQSAFIDNGGNVLELLVDLVTQPEFRMRAPGGAI